MNSPESGDVPAERHTGLEPQIPEFAARIIAELQSRLAREPSQEGGGATRS